MSLSDSSSERSFNSEDSEANLAEVEDEQSDCESQVSCESPENDIAYDDEPLERTKKQFLSDWLVESLVFRILAARKRVNKDDCSPALFFFCSRPNFSRRTRTENACYAG